MNRHIFLTALFLIFSVIVLPYEFSQAGGFPSGIAIETDTTENRLFSFFDLRDRETYIQVTNTSVTNTIIHIQVFNVDQDCNENNFFDTYTGNDTHVYNMRELITNDSNPSGVVLPENAYGFVAISVVETVGGQILISPEVLLGNLRIVDANGYEYRTNIANLAFSTFSNFSGFTYTFNFNNDAGIILSEVIGITFRINFSPGGTEYEAGNFTSNQYLLFDIDIINENENLFSCRNVIFACIDEDNPRQEELLSFVGNASVARFEYGINDALPHTNNGELLCPGNNIDEGFVTLRTIEQPTELGIPGSTFIGYIALNNGNDRGTIETFWRFNNEIPQPQG